MNRQVEIQELQIQTIVASFDYPATPDIAAGVRNRLQDANGRPQKRVSLKLAWAFVLVLLFAAGLMLVPQVRAAVLRMFNMGAITIFEVDEFEQLVGETAVLSATKPALPALIVQLGIAEEISLTEAIAQSSAPYYLPTYPANLAKPDHVYLTSDQPATIVSVWQADQTAEEPALVLYQIGAEQFAFKGATVLEETAVNGQWAIWMALPHYFWLQSNRWQEWQFVEGNVLIWWHEDGLTFRLEGVDSLAEAVRIAESLAKVEE